MNEDFIYVIDLIEGGPYTVAKVTELCNGYIQVGSKWEVVAHCGSYEEAQKIKEELENDQKD